MDAIAECEVSIGRAVQNALVRVRKDVLIAAAGVPQQPHVVTVLEFLPAELHLADDSGIQETGDRYLARIVLGVAASRSPLLAAGAHVWPALGARAQSSRRLRDRDGRVWSYDELLHQAPEGLDCELNPDVWARKFEASQAALRRLQDELAQCTPDVLLVMGDDEEEYIHDNLRPAITVYRGADWLNIPRTVNPDDMIARETAWQWGRERKTYPIAAELAEHVLRSLIEAEFDAADAITLQAMAHGFGFMYQRLLNDRPVPMVPLVINVHTPPAQPTPRRCYFLGRAVRDAVEAWPVDTRVAVVATGGLSVGIINEELDRRVINALQNRDIATIAGLPRAWMQDSTGEVLLWIAAAGALEHLQMRVLDYIAGYRTPAGTGTGLAFALWT